jgi:hypothetical protein
MYTGYILHLHEETMRVCETQMPPGETNSTDSHAISKLLKSGSNKSNIKVNITNIKGKDTRSNLLVQTERICHYKNIKVLVHTIQKIGQTPRSQGQISWYPRKALVTRNTHVKYQSTSTYQ